jgi:hypothetical protein
VAEPGFFKDAVTFGLKELGLAMNAEEESAALAHGAVVPPEIVGCRIDVQLRIVALSILFQEPLVLHVGTSTPFAFKAARQIACGADVPCSVEYRERGPHEAIQVPSSIGPEMVTPNFNTTSHAAAMSVV